MATRLQRAEDIFDEALAREAGEREAYVTRVCGDDAALRDEVLSLLKHDALAPDDFLRPPEPPTAPGDTTPDGPDPLIGRRIGRYDIKAVIGSGGMGTVFEAEQESPKRIVALKVMRRGVTSRYALRHFQRESQVLAQLRHPNIAQVFEAGTERSDATGGVAVPYFAMEYIPDARTITEYAEVHALGTRERLALGPPSIRCERLKVGDHEPVGQVAAQRAGVNAGQHDAPAKRQNRQVAIAVESPCDPRVTGRLLRPGEGLTKGEVIVAVDV